MPVERTVDDRLAAADPAPAESVGRWANSPEGLAVFERVSAASVLAGAAEGRKAPRPRRRLGRKLVLAGTFAVAVAALGLSTWLVLDGRDGGGGIADSGGARFVAPGGGSGGAVIVESGGSAASTPELPPGFVPPEGFSDMGVAGAATGSGPSTDVVEPVLSGGTGTKIVKTATMRVEVEEGELDDAHRTTLRAVERSGGFVQRSERTAGAVSLTVRVPADRFEEVLAAFADLGEVTGQSVSGQDVSGELVDIDARLRHWRAQEAVLLGIMERARTVAESVEVRRELAPVQETIERLEGRRSVLDDQVELSTVDLDVVDPSARSSSQAERDDESEGWFSRAWDRARGVAADVTEGTFLAFAVLVPLALLWLVPGYAIWRLVRRRTAVWDEAADSPE